MTASGIRQGLFPPDYYDPETLAAEHALFERHWQIVGMAAELARPDDFITARLAGRSVVVQNFGHSLCGFINVCSHRHSRIRDAECGHGPLRCPYHGWTYDQAGVPIGLPDNAEHFGLDWQARERLALAPVAVETLGGIVFARLAADGPGLDEALGDYAGIIRHLGDTMPLPFERRSLDWAANWKIGVESAIEGYHIDQIHPESFRPMVDAVLPSHFAGPHSYGPSTLSQPSLASIDRFATRLGLQRTARSTGYDHFFLFPNMMVIASAGTVLSLQVYEPTGPETTRLKGWMALGKSDKPGQRDGPVGHAVEAALRDFNLRVLGEDQRASERVQHGKHDAAGPALLGRNEDRIVAFHDAWRRELGRHGG